MVITIISLDDAIIAYDRYKRKEKNQISEIVYNINERQFLKAKRTVRNGSNCVSFINCHQTCLSIIEKYLNQPVIKKYKEACITEMSKSKDPVVSFLWFFEHIDGAYDFDQFENEEIIRVLKKWCEKNQFDYSLPIAQPSISTFLTEERKK